jgi:hypothetical protein
LRAPASVVFALQPGAGMQPEISTACESPPFTRRLRPRPSSSIRALFAATLFTAGFVAAVAAPWRPHGHTFSMTITDVFRASFIDHGGR